MVKLEGGFNSIFTDGACEPERDALKFPCSEGGILYHVDEKGQISTRAFGAVLDEEVVSAWAHPGKKHLIGPTELYAVVAARHLWTRYLDDRRTMFFVDHTGVHSACIEGSSRDFVFRQLLLEYAKADAAGPVMGWYARVPSRSNCADGPSGGDCSRFPVYGSLQCDPLERFLCGRVLAYARAKLRGGE